MHTRLYLVRHGETIWNKEMRYQGHSDVSLTEEGREQARLLAKKLVQEDIEAFYASDLSRAFETAQILAKPHKKEIFTSSEFRETKFGDWEGLKYTEIQKQYPVDWSNWTQDPYNMRIPGGESLADVVFRVSEGIGRLIQHHKDQNILLVAHGGVNRVILALALNMDVSHYWRIRQDNTALNIIDYYDDKAIVATFNDINHLKKK